MRVGSLISILAALSGPISKAPGFAGGYLPAGVLPSPARLHGGNDGIEPFAGRTLKYTHADCTNCLAVAHVEEVLTRTRQGCRMCSKHT
jgi:hypothetical protein